MWLDQSDLRGGDAWDTQIKKQIHECALFIPVISAHTNARTEGYFRREWNLAARPFLDMAQDTAFLVPVVIDETREADARVPRNSCARIGPDCLVGRRPLRLHSGYANCWMRIAPPWTTRTLSRGQAASRSRDRCTTGSGGSRVRLAAFAMAAVAVVFAFGWAVREWGARDDTRPSDELPLASVELPARSVAVLAFENRGGSEGSGTLAEGIPETVLHQLGLLPGLTVIHAVRRLRSATPAKTCASSAGNSTCVTCSRAACRRRATGCA